MVGFKPFTLGLVGRRSNCCAQTNAPTNIQLERLCRSLEVCEGKGEKNLELSRFGARVCRRLEEGERGERERKKGWRGRQSLVMVN